MKFEKFLKWIQYQLLNYPDLHFKTTKRFIAMFIKCLSEKERKRYSLLIQTIISFTDKQITIDNFILNNTIKILDKAIEGFKNG